MGKLWREVLNILTDKREIENMTTERVHTEKLYQNNKNNKGKAAPRATVCKLLNYKDKTGILQKCDYLKATSYYINKDFSKETLTFCKDLWK